MFSGKHAQPNPISKYRDTLSKKKKNADKLVLLS